ncbi:hypothetical protein Pcinc_033167 [Petrolisthes cinctipes]|uniref:Uncharacterized protein n=1 Tax=Petrolisthes cinctipes TaxID=88211 RepID=A0AAE1JZA9_PETCI|nr:hypothetical protein Pcinc_033167 [Petrolisthes cinctipes]
MFVLQRDYVEAALPNLDIIYWTQSMSRWRVSWRPRSPAAAATPRSRLNFAPEVRGRRLPIVSRRRRMVNLGGELDWGVSE